MVGAFRIIGSLLLFGIFWLDKTKKILFYLICIFYCSWQFGIPSVRKYMKKKTAIAKSTKILDFVPSPAVTIIPPWKVEQKGQGPDSLPPINCTNFFNTSKDVYECILDRSYNMSEIILKESHEGTWRTELTNPYSGIYWTRDDSFIMSTSREESYDIDINENMSTTTIILHDPHFFAINSNPVTIPKITRRGEKEEGYFLQLYVELTEVSKMNLPSNPCEASISHSLTKCIKKFVIKVQKLGSWTIIT